jgi:arylsulfatase A-like enzyme
MKSIVLLTLDCVRPDHLGCYGYRGVDTPNIDCLASEGVVFEQAVAQAPNTWVSHASIFTGCNPCRHGLRTPYTKLSSGTITMAEVLSQHGFATAAFPAHTLLGPALGFDRGFDYFDLDSSELKLSSMIGENRLYREWDAIWSNASAWMARQSGSFFVWLHYMGTHLLPLELLPAATAFLSHYSPFGQYYDGKISWADKEGVSTVLAFLEERGLVEDSLLVVFSDHGDMLIGDKEPYGRTVHNSQLRDEVMRIPLIIRGPSYLPSNVRVSAQVRSIDIMPTILELADISVPNSVDGMSLVSYCQQPSQVMRDSSLATDYAYMENLPHHWLGIRTLDWKLIMTDRLSFSTQEALATPYNTMYVLKKALASAVHILRTDKAYVHPLLSGVIRVIYQGLRWIYRFVQRIRQTGSKRRSAPGADTKSKPFEERVLKDGCVFALYDLRTDPHEQNDVSEEQTDTVRVLKQKLADMVKETGVKSQEIGGDDRTEIERRLEGLGYL